MSEPRSENESERSSKNHITIKTLLNRIEKEPKLIEKVKYKKLFVKTLKEIDEDIIGHREVKRKVSLQTLTLLKKLGKPTKNKPMLNIRLYGDPGVGKTLIGKKLAKLIYSIGYLKAKPKEKTTFDKFNIGYEDDSSTSNNFLFAEIGILLLVYIIMYFISTCFDYIKNFDMYGLFYFLAMFCFILLIVLAVMGLYRYFSKKKDKKSNKVDEVVEPTDDEIKSFEKEDEELCNNLKDDDIIKVVSREDFESRYMGGTSHQTKELLTDNLGKCIFIDECYSLYTGSQDQYGKEAIDTINRFVSENPDGIIIIFAGYEDQMDETIFAVQPGLKSRCMWSFNCDNYTPEDLYQILMKNIKNESLSISSKDAKNLKVLILKYKDIFKNQGRDMDRLLNYAKLSQDEDVFNDYVSEDEITYNHFRSGIKQFIANNKSKANKKDGISKEELRDILKQINI